MLHSAMSDPAMLRRRLERVPLGRMGTIDEGAIRAVTQLYRERLPAGGDVLDLMSSWVSHLPPEITYRRVVGLGMNAEELAANPRLDSWTVHDLNHDPRLPFRDREFDAAAIC